MSVSPSNTQILVCCHKECELPSDPYLLPIHVGAALGKATLPMQRDDEWQGEPCDNISAKNPSYCELTALYWAWKNLPRMQPRLEYVGVNHYRRYFDFGRVPAAKDMTVRPEAEVGSYRVNGEALESLLSAHDVVVPRNIHEPYSLFADYGYWRFSDDLRCAMRVVHELDPAFDEALYQVMMRSNVLAPYSMGVMGWDVFCAYCTWLFGVLAEVERRCDIGSYNVEQARIYGYIAERLWNVWLLKEGLKVVYLPIVMYADQSDPGALKQTINVWRRDVGFRLARPSDATTRERFAAIVGA